VNFLDGYQSSEYKCFYHEDWYIPYVLVFEL